MNRKHWAVVLAFLLSMASCGKPAPTRISVDKEGASNAKRGTATKKTTVTKTTVKETAKIPTERPNQPNGNMPELASRTDFRAPDPNEYRPPVLDGPGFANPFNNNAGGGFDQGNGGGFGTGLGNPSQPGNYAGLSASESLDRLLREVSEGLAQRPTLVVWLLDNSKSAQDIMQTSMLRLKTFYQSEVKPGLSTAVVSFAGEVKFVLENPSEEGAKVLAAFDALPADTTGKEQTFAAVEKATEQYSRFRTAKQDVVFVIITDEAGDDDKLVDEAIKTPKAKLIPIYVIGVPAPLGKYAGANSNAEGAIPEKAAAGAWQPIKQGPEGRLSDWVDFNTGGGGFGTSSPTYDSNFGPFALERLTRATGGKFFLVRSGIGSWPVGAARFDPEVMRKYAPDYISEADFQDRLSKNKAKQALVKAAELGVVNVSINLPQMSFPAKGGNEAEMKRRLDEAQRGPAKIEQPINSIFEAMKDGEKDRDALDSPRWQAAFDCAMGRVLAAKARVEGYNEMLAALKRGKTPKNAGSTTWSLMPADKTEGASQITSMSERARTYLTRVATEHKGTPWAMLAERDLQQQLGWQWLEN